MDNVFQLIRDHTVQQAARVGVLERVVEALVRSHPNKEALVKHFEVLAQQAFDGLLSKMPEENARDRENAQQVVDQVVSQMMHAARTR